MAQGCYVAGVVLLTCHPLGHHTAAAGDFSVYTLHVADVGLLMNLQIRLLLDRWHSMLLGMIRATCDSCVLQAAAAEAE